MSACGVIYFVFEIYFNTPGNEVHYWLVTWDRLHRAPFLNVDSLELVGYLYPDQIATGFVLAIGDTTAQVRVVVDR